VSSIVVVVPKDSLTKNSTKKTQHPMMLVCEYENASMWTLSMYIIRYITTIEGDYIINTYNIGRYNIVVL